MPQFPIGHDGSWADQSKGFHIHAVAHVTQQGQLWMQVTTSTNSWGLGFTGGAATLVKAADQTVIWSSLLHTAGVDAKSVFWGRSTRVDTYFSEWVPPDKLTQADTIEFLLGHTPHSRWAEDWKAIADGVVAAAKPIEEIIREAKTVFTELGTA